jgi:hypothetical protein
MKPRLAPSIPGSLILFSGLIFGSLTIGTFPTKNGETDSAEQEHWHQFSERCASISLKTLPEAEADFRANDRDWCHVNDFWTSNMKDLYTMTSASVAGSNSASDPAIRLIELSIASADGDSGEFEKGPEAPEK